MKKLETMLTSAFVGLSMTVCALFSAIILFVFLRVEDFLVRDQLETSLTSLDRSAAYVPTLEATRRLSEIPEPIRGWASRLGPGLHELNEAGWETHVLVRDTPQGRVYAFRRRPETERRERMVTATIVGTAAVVSLIGWLIARRLSSTIGGPITALAAQVEAGDPPETTAGRSLFRELDVLVGALAYAFRQSNEALQRERRFVQDVSHELRTPLTVIGGACEVLEDEGLEPRIATRIGRIRRAVESARETVEALLALARLEVQWERTNASPDLEAALSGLEALAQPGVEFETRVLAEPRVRSADEPLFRIAIANLTRNALENTDDGSVQVDIDADGARIADTGPGLPESLRDDGSGSGPGIGLAMVHRICKRSNWQLRFETGSRTGTVAVLALEPAERDRVVLRIDRHSEESP